MKVKELMCKLAKLPQEAEVEIDNSDGGRSPDEYFSVWKSQFGELVILSRSDEFAFFYSCRVWSKI